MKNYEILEDNENKLLDFRDVSLKIELEIPPKKLDMISLVSKELKVDEEKCAVRKIKGSFGKSVFLVSLRIYPDKKTRDKFELKKKKKKKKKKKSKK